MFDLLNTDSTIEELKHDSDDESCFAFYASEEESDCSFEVASPKVMPLVSKRHESCSSIEEAFENMDLISAKLLLHQFTLVRLFPSISRTFCLRATLSCMCGVCCKSRMVVLLVVRASVVDGQREVGVPDAMAEAPLLHRHRRLRVSGRSKNRRFLDHTR